MPEAGHLLGEKERSLQSQIHSEAVNRQGWGAWVWLRRARVASVESWHLASLKSQGSSPTGATFPVLEFSITHVHSVFFPSDQVFLPPPSLLKPSFDRVGQALGKPVPSGCGAMQVSLAKVWKARSDLLRSSV